MWSSISLLCACILKAFVHWGPKFSVGVLHSLLVILLARDLHVVAGDNCYEHLYLSLSALIVLKQLSLILCK